MNKRPTKRNLETLMQDVEACPDFDCRDRIMGSIQNGEVKPRSRWFLLTEYFGLRTSWIVLVLLLIAGINSTLFIISKGPQWEFIEFGPAGWTLFLNHIPYGFITIMAIMLLVIVLVMKSFSWSYLLPFKIFALLIVGGTFFTGAMAFATGINEKLYTRLVESSDPSDSLLAKFFCKTTSQPLTDENALLGEVMYADHQQLVVNTPYMEVITVTSKNGEDWLETYNVQRFTFVKMIGERQGDHFLASQFKQESSKTFPLQRTAEDCDDQKQWQKKREILELRRRAVIQPLSPAMGAVQLMKSIY